MTLEIFLMMLLVVSTLVMSTLTGLVTEALKIWLDEHKKAYCSNTLAGYVAVVLSVAVGGAYAIMTEAAMNQKMAVCLIALMLLSWLSAMIGYDKVMQAIAQIRGKKED